MALTTINTSKQLPVLALAAVVIAKHTAQSAANRTQPLALEGWARGAVGSQGRPQIEARTAVQGRGLRLTD